jgi:uncharacterized protein YidB (DUF937 family)
MGLLDNIFGSGSDPAVPGGNISKPLMIALLALLAHYMTSGSKDASGSVSPNTAPGSTADASSGDIVGGLGGLLKQFQQNGFGDAINSWISTGPNKSVTADQITNALGPDVIDTLSQRMGLSKEQISQILSQILPNTVDQLTPEGRLPTKQEISRLMA